MQTNRPTRPTNFKRRLTSTALSLCFIGLTACQTLPTKPINTTPVLAGEQITPHRLDSFNISGKMGFINKEKQQSASAFYTWAQEQERFAMQLEGALGVGYTLIEYNGTTATLTNAELGTVTADSPEQLLAKATGWNAPISQLPYWISGSPTPTDTKQATEQTVDGQHRLAMATNGDWSASFRYADDSSKLPKKIIAKHQNGSKVTLIIKHNQ